MKKLGLLRSDLPECILKGGIAAAIVWLAGSAVAAAMIGAEVISYESIGYAIVLILLASSLVSGKMILKCSGLNRYVLAAVNVLVITVMLFGFGWFAGVEQRGGILQSLLLVIAGTLCAILIKPKYSKRKYKVKY